MKRTPFYLLALLFLSQAAFSNFTPDLKITSVKPTSSGDVFVYVSGFDSPKIDCENKSFVLVEGEKGFEARYSAILAAHMASRKIKISYYNCSGKYIKISSVVVPAS